jgi:hypothetical protein
MTVCIAYYKLWQCHLMATNCPPGDGPCSSTHVGHILKHTKHWTVYLGHVSSHTAIQCRNEVLFIPAGNNQERTCLANDNKANLNTLYFYFPTNRATHILYIDFYSILRHVSAVRFNRLQVGIFTKAVTAYRPLPPHSWYNIIEQFYNYHDFKVTYAIFGIIITNCTTLLHPL